jgi:hypothetical protein
MINSDYWVYPKCTVPWAMDNGRYSAWSKGRPWNEARYLATLEKARTAAAAPHWIAVPDVVADALRTAQEWQHWTARLRDLGIEWPLAMCVQDGMTPASVLEIQPQPDVVFVGGTKTWKWRTLWGWCQRFPRVHVGRCGSYQQLVNAHRCGAESCDGTGFFRGSQGTYRSLKELVRYLELAKRGLKQPQLELEFARCFGGKVPAVSYLIDPRQPYPESPDRFEAEQHTRELAGYEA